MVKRMFEMAADGTPPSRIAMWINSQGVDDRRVLDGRQPWSPRTVLRVLRNRVYVGHMAAVADAHDAIGGERANCARRRRERGGGARREARSR